MNRMGSTLFFVRVRIFGASFTDLYVCFVFISVYFSLQFGSGKTLGAQNSTRGPTYVYPASLKRLIREVIPGDEVDRQVPTHQGVSFTNAS